MKIKFSAINRKLIVFFRKVFDFTVGFMVASIEATMNFITKADQLYTQGY